MERSNKLWLLGLILGVSIMVSARMVTKTFLEVKKMDNVITVSGSAKQQVTSDSARWASTFSRTATADKIKNGYAQMAADEKNVREFLTAQGFTETVEISPIFINEVYKTDSYAPKEYTLVQNVVVKSDDVNKLKETSKKSSQLADKGVLFSAFNVEYYFSKLPDLRISLLPEAIKDAKKRAGTIADSSDKQVDTIKSVSMGVVQVMPVGTVEISDYGSYDTSEIEKEVMVTVKTVFSLK